MKALLARRNVGHGVPDPSLGAPEKIGAYRVLRQIGLGGMGAVFEAEEEDLRRRVAVKVMRWGMGDQERFKREARALAKLHHPGLLQIYEFGEDQGISFIAMEYLDGEDLGSILGRLVKTEVADGAVEPGPEVRSAPTVDRGRSVVCRDFRPEPGWVRKAAGWVRDAAIAVEYGHDQGILHRDLKPSNLFLCRDGTVKVMDFGLARDVGEATITRTGDFMGTPQYMSPEQLLAKRIGIDHRTDIYSLGMTLYELLAGRYPYPFDSPRELYHKIALEEPEPLRQVAPWVPRDLETVVLKAMEKNPRRRYATAKAFADDLAAFLEGRPVRARRAGPTRRVALGLRRWWRPAAAAIVGMILAAGGFWVWYLTGSASVETEFYALVSRGDLALREGKSDRATEEYRQAALLRNDLDPGLLRDVPPAVNASADAPAVPADPFISGVANSVEESLTKGFAPRPPLAIPDVLRSSFPPAPRKLAFTAGGMLLAISGAHGLAWDFRTGAFAGSLELEAGDGTTIRLRALSSPSTDIEAWVRREAATIVLHDDFGAGQTGGIPEELAGHVPPGSGRATSAMGNRLVVGRPDGTLTVFDLPQNRQRLSLRRAPGRTRHLALSADGSTLAASGEDGEIWVAEILGDVTEEPLGVAGLALSEDGSLLAASRECGEIAFYHRDPGGWRLAGTTPSGEMVTALRAIGALKSVVWGTIEGQVLAWDGESESPIRVGHGHRAAVWALEVAPDRNTVFSAGSDGGIAAYDLARRKQVWSEPRSHGTVWSLALSSDGSTLASGGREGKVRFWDAVTGAEVRPGLLPSDSEVPISFLAWAGRDRLLVLRWDGSLEDTTPGETKRLSLPVDPGGRTVFLPSSEAFATIRGEDVHLHSLRDGRMTALRGVGDLVAGAPGADLDLVVGKTSSGFLSHPISARVLLGAGALPRLADAPVYGAVGHSGCFAETVAESVTMQPVAANVARKSSPKSRGYPANRVTALAALPGGRVVTGQQDGVLTVWDSTTGAELWRWRAHGSAVTWLGHRGEKTLLSSAAEPGEVAAWTIGTGVERLWWRSFAPGACLVAMGEEAGPLIVWSDPLAGEGAEDRCALEALDPGTGASLRRKTFDASSIANSRIHCVRDGSTVALISWYLDEYQVYDTNSLELLGTMHRPEREPLVAPIPAERSFLWISPLAAVARARYPSNMPSRKVVIDLASGDPVAFLDAYASSLGSGDLDPASGYRWYEGHASWVCLEGDRWVVCVRENNPMIRLWDLAGREAAVPIGKQVEFLKGEFLGFRSDAKIIPSTGDSNLHAMDPTTGETVAQFPVPPGKISAASWAGNGTIAASYEDLQLVKIVGRDAAGTIALRLPDAPTRIALDQDGRGLLTWTNPTSNGERVSLWDLRETSKSQTARKLREFEGVRALDSTGRKLLARWPQDGAGLTARSGNYAVHGLPDGIALVTGDLTYAIEDDVIWAVILTDPGLSVLAVPGGRNSLRILRLERSETRWREAFWEVPWEDLVVGAEAALGAAGNGVLSVWRFEEPGPRIVGSVQGKPIRHAISADGRRGATLDREGEVAVWDLVTCRRAWAERVGFGDHGIPEDDAPRSALPMAFSPSGRWIALGLPQGTARVWEAETGGGGLEIDMGGEIPTALCFSETRGWLLVGTGDGKVYAWLLENGKPASKFEGLLGAVEFLTVSESAGLLAGASKAGTSQVWHLQGERDVLYVPAGGGLSFGDDGRLLYTLRDGVLQAWDLTSPETTIRGPTLPELAEEDLWAAFIPRKAGGLVRVTKEGLLRVRGEEGWRGFPSVEQEVGFERVAVSSDGKNLLSCKAGGEFVLLDLETGYPRWRCKGTSGEIWSMALSPSARWAALAGPVGAIEVWDLEAKKLTSVLVGHSTPALELLFDGEDRLLSRGPDGIRVWNFQTPDRQLPLVRRTRSFKLGLIPEKFIVHPSSFRLLLGGRGNVGDKGDVLLESLDLEDGSTKAIGRLRADVSDFELEVSPDGRTLATVSGTGSLSAFGLEGGACRFERELGNAEAIPADFCMVPGGDTIVYRVPGGWRRRQVGDPWEVLGDFRAPPGTTSFAISTDGQLVGVVRDGTLGLLGADSANPVKTIPIPASASSSEGKPEPPEIVAVSDSLVMLAQDGELLLLDHEGRQLALNAPSSHTSLREGLQYLVTGSGEGSFVALGFRGSDYWAVGERGLVPWANASKGGFGENGWESARLSGDRKLELRPGATGSCTVSTVEGKEAGQLPLAWGSVASFAVSPSRTLAAAFQGDKRTIEEVNPILQLSLFRLPTGERVTVDYDGPTGGRLLFTDDGAKLLVHCDDGEVRILQLPELP